MSRSGAQEGNTYAKKPDPGKTISLYVSGAQLAAVALQMNNATAAEVVKQVKAYAIQGIQQAIKPVSEADQLRFLVSAWNALTNHAEAFAPELRANSQWCALKADLEWKNDRAGVTAFIERVAEQYREKAEADDHDAS